MRGEQGSVVRVSLLRNGQPKELSITRDVIPVSSIDAAFLLEPGTGYIRLNKFSSQTYHDFMVNLDSLVKKGMNKLVLDLRGNGGGLLDEAVEIADEFLDGDKLITYTEGRAFPKKEFRCRRNGLFEKGALVVLADEGSASASEVLMGALQDWDRATIIGRRSFGKGLVQEQFDLSDRSALRLTIARYYTPTGRSIQRSYAQGGKAYYDAIHHRILEDSLAATDGVDSSQVFHTKKGKLVYGGGGISPDILIPSDSTKLNGNLLAAMANGLVFDYGYRLLMLKPALGKAYPSPSAFEEKYQPDAFDWSVFQSMAAKDSVTLTETDKNYLNRRLKASVARQLWRNAGYYEVMSRQDPFVQKALEWLKK
ncbi:MAG TPA: S41 family peptidase, partial [Ferruginibacter sp.]|nr:S41 family peptidase [Ferruginibacter sp.]